MVIGVLFALCLAVHGAGCSFVFNRSSSSAYDPRRGDPDCDTCAGPIVDGIVAGILITGGAFLFSLEDGGSDESGGHFDGMYAAIGAVLIAWSLVHVVASLATIPSAARCSRDNEVHEWWSQVKKDIDSAELPPLHVAAMTGNLDMADALIERSAYVNERDQYGRTTLHWAAKKGHLDMVKFLVKKGADANITDKIGWTPLMHAEHNGHRETIEYLKKISGGAK